jgi:hypothetical protein
MEFPFWGKNPFDTSGSILQYGISILGCDFLLNKPKQGPQNGSGFADVAQTCASCIEQPCQ